MCNGWPLIRKQPVKKLALQLIAIMFLFWILIKVLMLFGTWGYANISEFFSDLFVRFFAVLVAVAFLYAPVKEVFSLTVSPLINMSAGLGVYITDLTFTQSEGQSFAAQAESTIRYFIGHDLPLLLSHE